MVTMSYRINTTEHLSYVYNLYCVAPQQFEGRFILAHNDSFADCLADIKTHGVMQINGKLGDMTLYVENLSLGITNHYFGLDKVATEKIRDVQRFEVNF